MDDVLGRADQSAVVIEAGVEGDGADDGIGGDVDDRGFLDQRAEGEADVLGALSEESVGVSVTVDRGVVSDSVFLGDGFRAAPVQEFAFDFGASRVMANATFAIVAR
jgi:hypothetical protein